MKNMILQIRGLADGKPFTAEFRQDGSHPLFNVKWEENGNDLTIRFLPKTPEDTPESVSRHSLVMESVRLSFPWEYLGDKKRPECIFMNGYQSWTDSHEKLPHEKEHTLKALTKPIVEKYHLRPYGDYDFAKQPALSGQFHGFTYCYFRWGEQYRFLGSLSEKEGFTIFYYDIRKQRMQIEKDCQGLHVNKAWTLFHLTNLNGTENAVFDAYFRKMKISRPKGRPMTGYTSWYNHYQNISETIILDNLFAAVETKQDWDIFQIDDGYQTHVGDWLSVDSLKFPNGLKPVADKIHQTGMKAGLWLAPFVCETNSKCFKEHPDWLERDKNGNPVCAGANWSGFYALDLENPAVKKYLSEVFHQVLDVWGFDLVKLDFLYAACIQPTKEKTRGRRMCEAMDFLRKLVGEKLILGCGVPLGAAFGKVDYCRIGCDVGLDWNDKPYMRMLHRERVSTKNAVGNAIYRRQLDGRAFFNDPDVYLLRDENIKLTPEQKQELAIVNGLFGSLLFTSDNVRMYDSKKQKFCESLRTLHTLPKKVIRGHGRTKIIYEMNGEKKELVLKV